jgi:hypothetical protein
MSRHIFDSPFQPLSLLTSTSLDLLSSAFFLDPSEVPRAANLLEASLTLLQPDRTLPATATAAVHYLAAIASHLSRPLLLVNPLPTLRALELLRTLGHERLIANAARDPEWQTLAFADRVAKAHAHLAALRPHLAQPQLEDLPRLRHQLADLANHVSFTLVHQPI